MLIVQNATSQVVYYSVSSGNWSDAQTWSNVSHTGSTSTTQPGTNPSDQVVISEAHQISLDLNVLIGSLTVGTPGLSGTLTFGNDNINRALTVNGPVTVGPLGTLKRNTSQSEGDHVLRITGDNGNLINNGSINFTDNTRPLVGWSVVDLYMEIGGNVSMGGSAAEPNSRLNSLFINKNNRAIRLQSNWSIAELLYIEGGVLELGNDLSQFTINSATTTATDTAAIRIDINGTLKLFGTSQFPTGYSTLINGENGTVSYAGTNQSIAPASVVQYFENMQVSGTGTKLLVDNIIIRKSLLIASGTTLNTSNYDISLSGDYTNNGTFYPGTGTFTFAGSENQVIRGVANFYRLTILEQDNDLSVTTTVPVAVALATHLLTGKLDLGNTAGNNLATVDGGGILAMSASEGLSTNFPSGVFTAFLTSAGTGTVEYNGTTSYIIGAAPLDYANVRISGASTKSLSGNITITKNLALYNTAIINTNGQEVNIKGNLINDGTIGGSGTYNFNNALINQFIKGSGVNNFDNLKLTKAAGKRLLIENDIRVAGELSLVNEGNLYLGTKSLTLGPLAIVTGASGGTGIASFSATRMIQQNGTNSASGLLIKEGTTASDMAILFPVGTGAAYAYMQITQLTASVTNTGSIAIKSIPLISDKDNLVKRYFRISKTNISDITDAQLIFKYDPAELNITGTPTLEVKRFADNLDYDAIGGFVNTTNSTFGVNTTGNEFLELEWRAGDPSNFAKTYYSYISGSWETPNTWTTDPTGTILQGQPAAGGPDDGDKVIILNGRTVLMTTNNTKQINSLEIQNGATLDVQQFGGVSPDRHNFGNISGAGLLRVATTSVPLGNYTDFTSKVGGTIEYYDYSGGLSTSIPNYNNVILSGTGLKKIGPPIKLDREINILGNFTVAGGIAQIGAVDSSKLIVNIYGDVIIASGASVTIGNNEIHELNFYKNIENEGNVDLVNSALYADVGNAGAAILTMKGASNNHISGAGSKFELYRLIVDKGVDQTYTLDVNPQNLVLFGRIDQSNGSTSLPFTQENPEIRKALWVRNGTLKLGSNINIPKLSSGGNDFFIPENGSIWLNGGTVATNDGTGSSSNTGLTLYGKLRVSSGTWLGNKSAGIVYRTISEIILEGGLIEVNQLRASSGGSLGAAYNRSAYVQSGGEFVLTGTGETGNGAAQFSLDKTSCIFRMSGGIIKIKNASPVGAIDIRAAGDNYEVTGGELQLISNNSNTFSIRSTIPFYNFSTIKGSNTATFTIVNNNLTILNNFNIGTNTTLNANNFNLSIGGNFDNRGTYTTGTNETIFNGKLGKQTVTSTSALIFNNLNIANTSSKDTVAFSGTGNVTVNGNLTLLKGALLDGGEAIVVKKNISNSSRHIGTGKISMNNATTAVAVIAGSSAGQFQNLEIDDVHGVALDANQTVNGTLTITNGILNLQKHNLTIGIAGAISIATPSSTKKLLTNGNKSDGGITKLFNSTGTFVFPFGISGNYSPATVTVNSADDFGSININPVNFRHPLVNNSNALDYFWTVASTGFSGNKSINYAFTYDQSDVSGIETDYLAGFYDNISNWQKGMAVNSATNVVSFANATKIDGDYTAGTTSALGNVVIYYSRQSGNWNSPSTWSTTAVGGPAASGTPVASNPVIIGDGISSFHTITISENGKSAGTLKLDSASILDLNSTTGHNFGASIQEKVKGNGKIRLSSSSTTAVFPSGDFGDFLSLGGGTVEYYGAGTSFTLPITSALPNSFGMLAYNKLILTPNANNISLPDEDIFVYNNMEIGTGSGAVLTSQFAAGKGFLEVGNNFSLNGKFQFINAKTRQITVRGDLIIENTGIFEVSSANTAVANFLYLYGSMENKGVFKMYNSGRYCNTYFMGTENETLSGNGSLTDFNRLILDKGASQTPVLEASLANMDLKAGITGTTKALELQNGTFKLTGTQTLDVSAGNNGTDYAIPSSAQIWLNGGSMRILNTGTGAGLLLAGKLKIDVGTMLIEGGGSNDNYIEIAGAGRPTIEINGGELRVGSQIRRANTSTVSALKYSQTGGNCVLATQSAPVSNRGVLEVLNSGSEFTMSGGALTISRQQIGSPTIAALYLQPASSAITGGTIQAGSGITPANQNIQIYSKPSLYNLTISAFNAPKATLTVGSILVKNNLTIESTATFDANDFDLTLERDFIADGNYLSGNNTTTFSSNLYDQNINGVGTISFNNLTIANTKPNGQVLLFADIAVKNTFEISAGTIDDNDRILSTYGRINNYAQHKSGGLAAGRLILAGSSKQILAGDGLGEFGNIEIKNAVASS